MLIQDLEHIYEYDGKIHWGAKKKMQFFIES